MVRGILVMLAVIGFGGMSSVAALAQERPRGHESAVGPSGQARGPGGMEERAPARGPVQPEGPAIAAPAVRQEPAIAPRQAPQSPALSQRPMEPPQQRAMPPAPLRPMHPVPQPQVRPNPGTAGVPGGGQPHTPNTAPHLMSNAPVTHAPHAVGAVPAPFHGNMRHFVDQDARVWNGGHWHHDRHHGRFGWWWVVGGGLWYYYPEPVYPYPDPFVPGDVVFGVEGAAQYWYYCASAGQYYPYVTYCPEGWLAVVPNDEDDAGE